jgi:hypothetical protein
VNEQGRQGGRGLRGKREGGGMIYNVCTIQTQATLQIQDLPLGYSKL